MLLFRYYDKDKKIDRAWYDSSNIIYSECDDNKDALKTLRIVFKKGDMYEYKEVDVNDYLMFMNGGLDGSNGKAFYKFIKPKYEVEKINSVTLDWINEELAKYREIKENEVQQKKEESTE